jgi:hypothetical protein
MSSHFAGLFNPTPIGHQGGLLGPRPALAAQAPMLPAPLQAAALIGGPQPQAAPPMRMPQQQPMAAPSAPQAGGGFWDRFGSAIADSSGLLMGMGGQRRSPSRQSQHHRHCLDRPRCGAGAADACAGKGS